MTKIKNYHLWDDDNYDPYDPAGPTVITRKKKKSDLKKGYEEYEEEDFCD